MKPEKKIHSKARTVETIINYEEIPQDFNLKVLLESSITRSLEFIMVVTKAVNSNSN